MDLPLIKLGLILFSPCHLYALSREDTFHFDQETFHSHLYPWGRPLYSDVMMLWGRWGCRAFYENDTNELKWMEHF